MMEGITVLNQTEIMAEPDCFLFVIIGGLLLGLFLFTLACCTRDDSLLMSSLIILLATMLSIPIMLCFSKPSGRYEYEVTIDKSVDFVEMYKKYEVIDQRGDIWVLEDKDVEE